MTALLQRLVLAGLLALPPAARAAAAAAPPLRVAALSTVLAEVARVVGRDDVAVAGILPPGVDPHGFEPSAAELRQMADADVILASGLDLESYLDRVVGRIGLRGGVVRVGDALPLVLATGGEKDPHWWHSVTDMKAATEIVRAAFARRRPEAAARFARNAEAYEARLSALQAWVAREIGRLPPDRRQLVTSHDAFAYFAHDYGFTVHPLSGLSTESEPDPRQLAALIDLIRARRIKAVFVEDSINPGYVASLVEETGVRVGGMLYADGLGPSGSDGETYVGMYRHNVTTLVDGLR